MRTPSTRVATDGSVFLFWVMPRMVTNEFPAFCICTIVTLGVSAIQMQ
jgi:hypothetical protein